MTGIYPTAVLLATTRGQPLVLDGGHLLFYACEAILGRPLGEKAQEYGFRIGLFLVLALMVFATRNDIVALPVWEVVKRLFS